MKYWFWCCYCWCYLVTGSWAQPAPWYLPDAQTEAPPFLQEPALIEDLQHFEHLMQKGYGRFTEFHEHGVDWEQVFGHLRSVITGTNQPWLTQHFLDQLIDSLQFTGDPSLQGAIWSHRRLYRVQVEAPEAPLFSDVRLVSESGRYRVVPGSRLNELTNLWLIRCAHPHYQLLPGFPQRENEQRWILAVLTSKNLEKLTCTFENDGGQSTSAELTLQAVPPLVAPSPLPVFETSPERAAYLHWWRDGTGLEPGTKQFYKLTETLASAPVLILDVRGNREGSFAFIERWLKPLTNARWQNVVVREKHSELTLHGLRNRWEWRKAQPELTTEERLVMTRDQQQIQGLLQHIEGERWVETKFLFAGQSEGPAWSKRLIVIANRECGPGCQFLVALAKSLPNAVLVGENTGFYPRAALLPLYQLPHSKILLTVSHLRHLDSAGHPIAPTGYQPDFWLEHPQNLEGVYRLAHSAEFPY